MGGKCCCLRDDNPKCGLHLKCHKKLSNGTKIDWHFFAISPMRAHFFVPGVLPHNLTYGATGSRNRVGSVASPRGTLIQYGLPGELRPQQTGWYFKISLCSFMPLLVYLLTTAAVMVIWHRLGIFRTLLGNFFCTVIYSWAHSGKDSYLAVAIFCRNLFDQIAEIN